MPTVEFGGVMLLHMLRTGDPAYINSPLREDLFRAGHAHETWRGRFAALGMKLVSR